MFSKAVLSRSRLALVLASAFALAAAAWQAPSADAAAPVPAAHDASNFFDASLAWLNGGPTVRNGRLDGSAHDLVVSTDATPFVAREVRWHITKSVDNQRLDVAPGDTATGMFSRAIFASFSASL